MLVIIVEEMFLLNHFLITVPLNYCLFTSIA